MADVQLVEISGTEGAQIINSTVEAQQPAQVVLAVPGVQGATGSNLPSSGTTHQVLFKQSNTNYDTGWKLITNDNVDGAAAIAGTKISPDFGSQTVQATGVFSHALGSAAAPSITFTGDVNTGLYSPGADQLAISTSGTGRLFVDASGKVGIGTSSPSQPLEVRGPVGATEYHVAIGDVNLARILVGYKPSSFAGTTNSAAVSADNGGSLNFATRSDVANVIAFATSTGTGAATERARIDSSGRLLVGTSSARTNFYNASVSPQFLVESTGDGLIANVRNTNSNTGPTFLLAKSRGTAIGSNTLVLSNDSIGQISFQGSDGTEFVEGARIEAFVDGTPGANDLPTRLVFSTTADGAASPTEAMRINNQRELLIGTTTRTANGGVLQISNGITFPGTQSACSDPNTLDDYEEGTWTVTFYDATTAGNASATTATGDYTKVGNTVRATFSIDNINTTGLTAGNIFAFTLPFTHAGTYESTGSCAFASVTLGAGYTGLTSFIAGNATRGYFLAWGNNIGFANAPVSYFNDDAADLRVTITYKAA